MKIARILMVMVPMLALGAAGDSTAARRGWLGVYTDDLTKPMLVALDIDHGVLVTDVADESPAAKAGIEAGDVILSLDGESIADASALRWAVRDRPEQKVGIKFRRRGKDRKLEVKLEARELVEQALDFEWPAIPSEALREAKRALREAGPALKLKLEHSDLTLDSLREQLAELRNELNELRKKLTESQKNR
jgi:membrane-associated protease RseP (regulator of RpoE activity)